MQKGFLRVRLWLLFLPCAVVECAGARVPVRPAHEAAEAARVERPRRAELWGPASPHARTSEADIARSVHLALGLPRDADPSDDDLIDERSFVLSYSPRKHVPNWVAWRLDRTYLGHVRRRNDFRPDPALPGPLYHVAASDYWHSGYDRGHMCPSADREDTADDNSRTFLFTNMQPQLHELNAGPWERLERYARERAEAGAVLYIVAGGVFGSPFATIGNGVAVPTLNFKIVVALRPGETAADIGPRTEVLAVLMPNQRGVGEHAWTEFLTSVDAIERATGYDFLNAVAEPVQRVIEARTAVL